MKTTTFVIENDDTMNQKPESPWTAELAAKRLREEPEWTGVQVERQVKYPLHYAVFMSWPQAVRSLLATGDWKTTDTDWLGRTPLQLLAETTLHWTHTVPTDYEIRRLLCHQSGVEYERCVQKTHGREVCA